MPVLTYTLPRGDDEIEVKVKYEYYAGYRGYRNKYGVPEEPDEPPDIEIVSVTDINGKEVEISNIEEAEIWELCMQDVSELKTEAMINNYEARMEAKAENQFIDNSF